MRLDRRGSALLLVLILGSVLLLGLAALIGTALTEHRGSERAALNSAAFHLAEAGVDRSTRHILDDDFASNEDWTTRNADTYTRTFTSDSADLGGRTGGYTVVVKRAGTLFTVSSQGWAQNNGASIRAERAVEVVFERQLGAGGTGHAGGCIAITRLTASSTGASSISATQVGPAFDSYRSENNTAPSPQNRDNKTTVGTLSAADNALNLGNGSYYATVSTGSSPANPVPAVSTATNASPPNNILARLDDLATDQLALVDYNPALVRHDLDFTVDAVLPPSVSPADGWFTVLPRDGAANSQWKLNGKLSDLDPAQVAGAGHVARQGNTLSIGTSNIDRHYVATTSLDNISSIQVSGEVILVCLGPINASNGLVINYRTPDAKLTIYSTGNISGVIRTTQQINTANATPNWQASRLAIGMLPGNSNINMASLEPVAINAHVSAALMAPTAGGTITMNFDDRDTFVGQITAPYSFVQLSAVGQVGKLSDYCGSLLADTISITGSNGFAFHYDQDIAGGGSGADTPKLIRTSWRQLAASDGVFR